MTPDAANVSILYPDLPVEARPARARADGFTAIESWWPFPTATPSARDVDGFAAAVRDAGVELVALNVFGGDMAAGERGLATDPGRAGEFADAVAAALEIGARLGTRMHNTLVGNGAALDDDAVARLAAAVASAAAAGSTLLIEPLSGGVGYPVRTVEDARGLVARVRTPAGTGAGVLADLYHLAVNGEDVDAAIAAHGASFTHVQVADHPGRGAPGTGGLPIAAWLAALERAGYRGHVALEHHPAPVTG